MPETLSAKQHALYLQLSCLCSLSSRNARLLDNLSLRTVKKWYRLAKAQGQLSSLTPLQMSSLISLIGSLSAKACTHPELVGAGIPMHPLATSQRLQPNVPQWSWVTHIFNDKLEVHGEVTIGDRSWLAFSLICQVHELCKTKSNAPSDTLVDAKIATAQEQYLFVRQSSDSSWLHMPFLQVLATQRGPKRTSDAVKYLCHIFRTSWLHFDRQLPDVVWRLLAEKSSEFSESSQRNVVEMLREQLRVEHSTSTNAGCSAMRFPSSRTLDDSGVTRVLRTLQNAIFPRTASSQLDLDQTSRAWATEQARIIIGHSSLSYADSFRRLSIIARALDPSAEDVGSPLFPIDGDWPLFYALSALENHLGSVDAGHDQRLVDAVWNLWRTWREKASHPPDSILREIAVTFMRLASFLEDAALREEVHESWNSIASSSSIVQRRAYAVQYVLAAPRGKLWSRQFMGTRDLSVVDQAEIVSAALRQLLISDLQRAQSLYAYAVAYAIKLRKVNVVSMGVQFAQGGFIRAALACLKDCSLNERQHLKILWAILHSLRGRSMRTSLPREIAMNLSKLLLEFASLFRREVAHSKSAESLLKSAVLSLVYSDIASRATAVCDTIFGASALSVTFLRAIFRGLIKRKASRHAITWLRERHPPAYEEIVVQGPLVSNLIRTRSHELVRRVLKGSALSSSLFLEPFLRLNRSKSRSRWHIKLSASRILYLFRKQKDKRQTQQVMRLLLAVKHTEALRRLRMDHVRQGGSVEEGTKLGNALLSAQLDPPYPQRSSQRLKHALLTFKALVKEGSFVPDRVTHNILLKGLLRLHADSSFGSTHFRTLFTSLLLSGYPHGGYGQRPFESGAVRQFATVHIPSAPDISWERHAKPLYKLFIKAFQECGDKHAAFVVVGILKAMAAHEHIVNQVEDRSESRMR